jgi:hypothetical protein
MSPLAKDSYPMRPRMLAVHNFNATFVLSTDNFPIAQARYLTCIANGMPVGHGDGSNSLRHSNWREDLAKSMSDQLSLLVGNNLDIDYDG